MFERDRKLILLRPQFFAYVPLLATPVSGKGGNAVIRACITELHQIRYRIAALLIAAVYAFGETPDAANWSAYLHTRPVYCCLCVLDTVDLQHHLPDIFERYCGTTLFFWLSLVY